MKLHTLTRLALTVALIAGVQSAFAQSKNKAPKRVNVEQDVDSLGGNEALMQMAQSLDPQNRARIVQRRAVERNMRFEFGVSYGGIMGGDPYVRTQNLGASVDFHLNPRWSIGARYFDHRNGLTPEGQRVFDEAREAQRINAYSSNPDIDYPLSSAMAVLNWYPVYGKTSFLENSVTQFDMYLLAGGGQMQLSSGSSALYTAGVGVGIWASQHFTIRGEVRYQNYKDYLPTNGATRNIHAGVASVGMGFLL
ncbi:MAG: outer membrane beta-barrel domain-containing protein [Bdellovibrionaceae bacterium]|nr:outer membrane beta-barrel domain-containing protein [Pseudobdellovibrionaceae bacterium]MBX3035231.1 outer membrane beta-barrel domain-containing protein [Pseudobdellovibrionaceae bacterium]